MQEHPAHTRETTRSLDTAPASLDAGGRQRNGVPGLLIPRLLITDALLNRLFLLSLLAYVCFALWLPVFPTGDGPVHLYYSDVLWSLVRHRPTYASVYAVRHVIAPYLVHYFALGLFSRFCSPAMAEKLFIAIIFVNLALGFRYLARGLGRNAAVVSVWMIPLLYSWSIGGGFLNCCFATGLAFWSFGLWARLGAAAGAGHRVRLLALFVVSLAGLVLSHPVPLLVLLLFTASDLLLRVLGGLRSKRNSTVDPTVDPAVGPSLGPSLAAFGFTCIAFLSPVLLAEKGQAAAVLPGVGFHKDVLLELLVGMRLGLFAGITIHTAAGLLALLARIGLLAIIPLVSWSVMKSWRARWREHAFPFADRLLLISLVFLFATVIFPRSLNGSFFFPQRMWDIVWPLALASGAGAVLSPRARNSVALAGFALIAMTAASGFPRLARIAKLQQALAEAPLPSHEQGLFLEPARAVEGKPTQGRYSEIRIADTTYPVYFWSGARAFEHSRAILLNSPWLGLTILPVREAPQAKLLDTISSIYSENPVTLTEALEGDSQERTAILARADFLLYSDPDGDETEALEATHRILKEQAPLWQCDAQGFYAVCVKHTAAPR